MQAIIRLDDAESSDPLSRQFISAQERIEVFSAGFLEANWPTDRLPHAVEVSLTFLTLEEMARLNGESRGVDAPTDVLSFPLWDFSAGEDPCEGPEGVPLGDVVFCLDRCRYNAAQAGVTPQSEMALLWCHSLLHLLGYDHVTAQEQDRMWAAQEAGRDRMVALMKVQA